MFISPETLLHENDFKTLRNNAMEHTPRSQTGMLLVQTRNHEFEVKLKNKGMRQQPQSKTYLRFCQVNKVFPNLINFKRYKHEQVF